MTSMCAYALATTYGTSMVGRKNYRTGKVSRIAPKTFRAKAGLAVNVDVWSLERSPLTIKVDSVDRIKTSSREVRLSRPITIHTSIVGRFFVDSNSEFGVFSYGLTPEEARANFGENFEELLDIYTGSDKNDLIGDAIRIKTLFDGIEKK